MRMGRTKKIERMKKKGRCDGAVVKKQRHLSRGRGFDSLCRHKLKPSTFPSLGAIPLAVIGCRGDHKHQLPPPRGEKVSQA